MNTRVMMVLALLLVIGAVVAGYWGLSLSRAPGGPAETDLAPCAAPEAGSEGLPERLTQAMAEPRQPVVVLTRDIAANQRLTAEDLAVEQLRIAPPGSFADPAALVGRQLWHQLPGGVILQEASFEVGGPLARMIRSNERALAIAVDEVVAAGGHLGPGDYVDVLLFLREDERNSDRTVQVVVPALRVLGVGSALGTDLSGDPIVPPPAADDEAAQNGRRARPEAVRSAVLAVPEDLLTRFTLAAEVGQLRLAVRSAEEQRLARYYEGESPMIDKINQQLYQFEKFVLRRAERPQPGLVPVARSGIPVVRGNAVSNEKP